jgi:hypothetical protein
MKALTRVCEAGLGPVHWGPMARKLSLDGIPRLAALVGPSTRHVGHPRAGGLEDRLECAHPGRP